MFIPPVHADYTVPYGEAVEVSVKRILSRLGTVEFDEQKPTALLVGRFQPFHEGHRALVEKAIDDVGQCIIGLRDTGVDENNPLTIAERAELITASLGEYAGRYMILQLPNVTKVVYGRTPGYEIEQYKLNTILEAISGTQRRKELRQ
jgi:cytidyltransferase-like protein